MKSHAWILAILLCSCARTQQAPIAYRVGNVTPNDLSGVWMGKYTYDNQGLSDVVIFATLKCNSGQIEGKLVEPNTFGPTDALMLSSLAEGSVNSLGQINLDFTYDGHDGVNHRIVNSLSLRQDIMSGSWRDPKNPKWTGKIDFYKVADLHHDVLKINQSIVLEIYGESDGENKKTIPIHGKDKVVSVLVTPALTIDDIASAWIFPMKETLQDGKLISNPILGIQYTKSGTLKNDTFTKTNVNQRIALVINGEVYSEPLIISPSKESSVMSGSWTTKELEIFVDAINNRHKQ